MSQCVGAGEFDQARAYLKKIAKWTYGIMAAVNLTIIALLPLIMRVYNVSPEAEKLAVTVTLIHGISSIFIWVPAFMVPGFLRAAGDAKFTMLASMLTMWVVRVLLAYVLGKYMGYGVIGVWFAHAIVDWTVRGAIFLRATAAASGRRWESRRDYFLRMPLASLKNRGCAPLRASPPVGRSTRASEKNKSPRTCRGDLWIKNISRLRPRR